MKKITLRFEGGFEIMVIGERLEFLSNVVSATKVEKLMDKSCKAYLTYVLNSRSKELRV